MKRKAKRNRIYVAVLAALYIFLACGWLHINYASRHAKETYESAVSRVYRNIEKKGAKFVFCRDSLVYWQDNSIPLESSILKDKDSIADLANGKYLKKTVTKGDSSTVYLYLIKHCYPKENEYLDNSLNETLSSDRKLAWQKFLWKEIMIITVCLTLVWTVSLMKRRRYRWWEKGVILIPLYTLYIFISYIFCTRNYEFYSSLYTYRINYDAAVTFSVMIGLGYLLYRLTMRMHYMNKGNRWFVRRLFVALILSIICGATIEVTSYFSLKDLAEKKARSLAENTNAKEEQQFARIFSGIENDTTISRQNFTAEDSTIENYIRSRWIKPLDENWHTGIMIFTDNDVMTLEPDRKTVSISAYAQSAVRKAKKACGMPHCYKTEQNEGDWSYIYYNTSGSRHIFIECLKKKISDNMNYSLLLSEKEKEKETSLSYARYTKEGLMYSKGERTFQINSIKHADGWEKEKDYMSYYLNKNSGVYVVSIDRNLLISILGAISMMFLTYCIILSLEYFINHIPYIRSFSLNIKNAVLTALIGSFTVSLVFIGGIAIWRIFVFSEQSMQSIVNEKTASIQLEIEKRIASNGGSISESELIDISNSFLTDINIFSYDGVLYQSSQKDIFLKGYISDRMDYTALEKMRSGEFPMFCHNESIDGNRFVSSYCPVRNSTDAGIAFINIPYISQERIMQENINSMIKNLANVFLFWTMLAVVVFILISNIITKPLETLKDKLAKINVEKENEKIEWKKDDEMGELIKTYNLMVDKISESLLLLKEHEREASWQELARQVAHDIRNPLTPMKLSIQYLQKVYDERRELFDEKFRQIAPSLILQIESISNITTELSSYAQRNSLKKEKVDLNECIRSAMDVFENVENVTIECSIEKDARLFVLGEKKLFVRIFNNILKNACQSFREDEDGTIEISCRKEENRYVVCVRDNGCGISEENKSRIFSSHFSTKENGSGIGLTIVKSILESCGAGISFESQEGVGTAFFMSFPVFEENS